MEAAAARCQACVVVCRHGVGGNARTTTSTHALENDVVVVIRTVALDLEDVNVELLLAASQMMACVITSPAHSNKIKR